MEELEYPETAKPIILGDIVNPGLMWASLAPGVNEKVNHFCEFNIEFQKRFASRSNRDYLHPKDLVVKQRVAVLHPVTRSWYRGLIENADFPDVKVKVFLTDLGVSLNVQPNAICDLPEELASFELQAFLIALYGVTPLSVELDVISEKTFLAKSDWTNNHLDVMKKLIDASLGAYFETIKEEKNVKYGHLYLDLNHTVINVSKELQEKNLILLEDRLVNVDQFLSKFNSNWIVKEVMQHKAKSRSAEKENSKSRQIIKKGRESLDSNVPGCANSATINSEQLSVFIPEDRKKAVASSKLSCKEIIEPNQSAESYFTGRAARKSAPVPAGFGLRETDSKKKSSKNPPPTSFESYGSSRASVKRDQQSCVVDSDSASNLSVKSLSRNSELSSVRRSVPLNERNSFSSRNGSKINSKTRRSNPDSSCNFNRPSLTTGRQRNSLENCSQGRETSRSNSSHSSRSDSKTRTIDPSYDSSDSSQHQSDYSRQPWSSSQTTSDADSDSEAEALNNETSDEEKSPLLRAEKVLAHTSGSEVEVASVLEDLELNEDVLLALKRLKVFTLYRLQAYACKAIHDWQDVAMVHQEKTGKSVSYIIPLIDFLHNKVHFRTLPQTNCPRVLIVCPWSSTCENIAKSFSAILNHMKDSDVKIGTAYSDGEEHEQKKLVSLINGCEVLITTPRFLLTLLEKNQVLNFGHVCNFVLDGCNALFKYFEPEVEAICQKINVLRIKRRCQVIATAEVYDIKIDNLMRGFLKNPTILIASAMEAAIYGKCPCKVTVTSLENKFDKLLAMLSSMNAKELKTVIFCNKESVIALSEKLKGEKYNSFPVEEYTIFDENVGVSHKSCLRTSTEGVAYPVIVCHDGMLNSLNICDARILIHYDLPTSKSAFSFRYSTIYANIHNRLLPKSERPFCKIGLIIDTMCNDQFPAILDYIKRSLKNVEIPPEAEKIAAAILHKREEEKVDVQLCSQLLKYGECWPKSSCPKRHVFLYDVDCPLNVPKQGFVKVKILHVLDASQYSVRLLEQSKDGITWVENPKNYALFSAKLNLHFIDIQNRFMVSSVAVGDLVIFENTINNFKRAIVVELMKERRGRPRECKIKLIDEGYTIARPVLATTLLTAPDWCKEDPPYAIKVFLTGLKPIDLDHSWSRNASKHMRDQVEKMQSHEADGYFFFGQIVLAIESTFWLNPFEVRQHMKMVRTDVMKFSFKQELLKCKYAVKNEHHLHKLTELCRLNDLPMPNYVKEPAQKPVKKTEPVKPQWAHLPMDEVKNVFLLCSDNPSLVFVRHADFSDRLESLEKTIQEKMLKRDKEYLSSWKKGDLCLANYRQEGPDVWYRAKVKAEPTANKIVEVYYVDHGDTGFITLEQLTPIDPEFISPLPFQAIECSLVGIAAIGDKWDPVTEDIIDEFSLDEHRFYNVLQVKVVRKFNDTTETGGSRYSVVLRDAGKKPHIIINKEIVNRGYAKILKLDGMFLNESFSFKNVDTSLTTEEKYVENDASFNNFDSDDDEETWSNPEELLKKKAKDIMPVSKGVHEDDYLHFCAEKFTENLEEEDEKALTEFAKTFFSNVYNIDPSTIESEPLDTSYSIPASETANKLTITDVTSTTDSATQNQSDYLPINAKDGKLPISAQQRGTKCPIVLWHQNSNHVILRVQLIGVVDYGLECDGDYLGFICELNGDTYSFEMNLCGAIITSEMQVSVKGFYVEIKMVKATVGLEWPRLTEGTTKHPWIKVNHEYYQPDDYDAEEDSPFSCEAFDYGIPESERGTVDPLMYKGHRCVPEGFSESSDEEELWQEGEEKYNRPEDPYDLFS